MEFVVRMAEEMDHIAQTGCIFKTQHDALIGNSPIVAFAAEQTERWGVGMRGGDNKGRGTEDRVLNRRSLS
jgi:hypothetical protein